MAYMSSGYGVPLAAQDYTWCLGSNMEPCYTSCRFAVRHSSEPGPLESARCAHSSHSSTAYSNMDLII
ncbi:hypothetical protein CgunFtcFv8_024595 [Champsocephalus gunnari]|uniref:Uncharacterized protein n=1 Tax=Champsocephalus gunnari TaxID=52237 RepID=A0AAN8DMS3_CHAGU|nr:hypothetical protein CgunFtcFv8_024595 [Champsocephalus gunnari]